MSLDNITRQIAEYSSAARYEDLTAECVHAAVQRQMFTPLFCTSATSNVGVARLLDFIAKYGPSPADRATVNAQAARGGAEIQVRLDGHEPVAQVFKTMNEEHFGELSFFRVYSGQIVAGSDLFNSSRNITERIGQIFGSELASRLVEIPQAAVPEAGSDRERISGFVGDPETAK